MTRALDDAGSPARAAVDRLLADPVGVRDLQREYREAAGPLLVESRGGNAGTIGTAFDLLLRFLVHPSPDLRMAAHGASKLGESGFASLLEIVADVGGTISGPVAAVAPAAQPLLEPLPEGRMELGELARACWAMALLVEVYRRGGVAPGSPLDHLDSSRSITSADYLALATSNDVAELAELAGVAQVHLLPVLANCPPPWYVGPIFAGSKLMDADADLIAGQLLVEVKTNLGSKQPGGQRRAALTSETLRQILGYVLHDTDDAYQLSAVAVYDARYGLLTTWALKPLLTRLSGRQVEVDLERSAYARMLSTGSYGDPPLVSSGSRDAS